MAAEDTNPQAGPISIVSTADGLRAEVVLTGDIGAATLRELEERLDASPLAEAAEWVVEMSGVTHLDLACAYALLRAAGLRADPAALTIRGARRTVRRTLRHAGLDAVATIEE
ncbi:STAS domain-containing protein [Streptomyces sp. WMMC940]|uniref:STAS domain-containing protein n=1 Tax=Streptomyces sp. WMMC940 TaxID=3015153 RepID=UPI0022B62FC5|nr:STAS domain-containing protein [Streptomyces sp. WMMC940]MCZ7456614.1 STAS domain-containing protein [Streptomyces sp. WMMC940]